MIGCDDFFRARKCEERKFEWLNGRDFLFLVA